jgi:predicted metal-dependent hydrolase
MPTKKRTEEVFSEKKEPALARAKPEARKILYADVSVRVSMPMSTPIEEMHEVLADIQGAMRRHLDTFLVSYPKKKRDIRFETS